MTINPCRPKWKGSMTDRERFVNQMHYKPVDRCFNMEFGYWQENFSQWPLFVENRVTNNAEADVFFNFDTIRNVGGTVWLSPPFENKVVSETSTTFIKMNGDGLLAEGIKLQADVVDQLHRRCGQGGALAFQPQFGSADQRFHVAFRQRFARRHLDLGHHGKGGDRSENRQHGDDDSAPADPVDHHAHGHGREQDADHGHRGALGLAQRVLALQRGRAPPDGIAPAARALVMKRAARSGQDLVGTVGFAGQVSPPG